MIKGSFFSSWLVLWRIKHQVAEALILVRWKQAGIVMSESFLGRVVHWIKLNTKQFTSTAKPSQAGGKGR
jgi:hypothetical protein